MFFGWSLFVKAVQLVAINVPQALRISLPFLISVTLGVGWILTRAASVDPTSTPLLAIFFASVLIALATLWTIVAWHRYILLEEQVGLLPALHVGVVLSYLGRVLLISLLLLMASLPVNFLVGAMVQSGWDPLAILSLLKVGLAPIFGYIVLRLCLILPAVAIGTPLKLSVSWRMTADHGAAIWGLSLILVVLGAASQWVVNAFPGVTGIIVALAWQWVTMMVGASVFTTLYGHIIEDRPID